MEERMAVGPQGRLDRHAKAGDEAQADGSYTSGMEKNNTLHKTRVM